MVCIRVLPNYRPGNVRVVLTGYFWATGPRRLSWRHELSTLRDQNAGYSGLASVQQRIGQISNTLAAFKAGYLRGLAKSSQPAQTGKDLGPSFQSLLDEYSQYADNSLLANGDADPLSSSSGLEDASGYVSDSANGLALASRIFSGLTPSPAPGKQNNPQTINPTRSIAASPNSSVPQVTNPNVKSVVNPSYKVAKWHHLTPEENHGMLRLKVWVVDEQGRPIDGVRIKRQTSDGVHTDYATSGDKDPGVAEFSFETANHTGGNWNVSVDNSGSEVALNLRTDIPDEGDGNTRNHNSYDVVFQKVGVATKVTGGKSSIPGVQSTNTGNIVSQSSLGKLLKTEDQQVAVEKFEKGTMVWSGEKVYVINNDGTVKEYQDSFKDGMQLKSGAIPPTAYLQEPVRGFGKVWRENNDVKEKLGWATEKEYLSNAKVTTYENGSLFRLEESPYPGQGQAL